MSDYGNVPAESSVLCETCGYTLDGLPPTGKCPECGSDIISSRENDGRSLPLWEDTQSPRSVWSRFWNTTGRIIFHNAQFYRTLATRRDDPLARRFAQVHWVLSAILIGGALCIHVYWYQTWLAGPSPLLKAAMVLAIPAVYLVLWGTTALATRLTAWEAAYRGIRLPLPVVLRSMYYHAAHYLPVGLSAFILTAANWLLTEYGTIGLLLSFRAAQFYLVALCVLVLLCAAYLFKTYWAGMRKIMYANR